MFEFIYLFLFRSLSGLQNGLGYAQKEKMRLVFSILLMIASYIPLIFLTGHLGLVGTVLTALACSISAFGVFAVEDSFNTKLNWLPTDVHAFEIMTTAGIVLACFIAGRNLLMVAASVYPALLLHKGFINLYSGLSFWSSRTDDATGQTFSIPLLNISVKRGGTTWRVMLAIFSIILAVFTIKFNWIISINIIDLHGSAN